MNVPASVFVAPSWEKCDAILETSYPEASKMKSFKCLIPSTTAQCLEGPSLRHSSAFSPPVSNFIDRNNFIILKAI
jgi:hypothetical protein